jgi:hypothetical protein
MGAYQECGRICKSYLYNKLANFGLLITKVLGNQHLDFKVPVFRELKKS